MQTKIKSKKFQHLIALCFVAGLVGCAPAETVVTREVTEEGPNSVQNIVIKERRAPGGRRTLEREITTENIQCVSKQGKIIPVGTVEECIASGGHVVDEVIIEKQRPRHIHR